MCGITGWFDQEGNALAAVKNSLLSLKSRGPDDFGAHQVNAQLAIGQTRLAVTGTPQLPWVGRHVSIAHNGEIYNWKELAQKNKLNLSSDNDSEVILRFLEQKLGKGKTLLNAVKQFMQQANGNYAVVGTYQNCLFAFRDPVGIRPLFIGQSSRYSGFSSDTLSLKVKNCTFPIPLKPGHLAVITKGKLTIRNVLDVSNWMKKNKKTTIDSLHHAMKQAADLETHGLQQCGVLFSGGVDSSLIAQLVIQRVPNVTLYSVGMEGSSDLIHAKEAALRLGKKVKHELIVIKPDEIRSLTMEALKQLEHFDLLQTQLAVPMLALAKHIAGKGKVLFSGQGSDELFGGYKQYQRVYATEGKKGAEKELEREVKDWWARNLDREDRMMGGNGIEERFIFWNQLVIKQAFSLPLSQKIKSKDDEVRKHAIRTIALREGLPHDIALRPKHALQYSTGVAKAVEKVLK